MTPSTSSKRDEMLATNNDISHLIVQEMLIASDARMVMLQN